MELAAGNHELAALADLERERALADERVGFGTLLPVARLSTTITRNDREVVIGDRVATQLWDYSASAQLSVDLFRGSAIPEYRALRYHVDGAAERGVATRAELRLAAGRAYMASLVSYANVEAARDALALSEASARQTETLYELGYAMPADVAQTSLAVARAQTQMLEAEIALEESVAMLAFVTQRSAIEPATLVTPELADVAQRGTDGSPSASIRALGAALDAAELRLEGLWLDYLPSASLVAQYNVGRESLRAPNGTFWQIGLTLTWVIFDHTRYGRREQIASSVDTIEVSMRHLERERSFAVESAERRYRQAIARLELAESTVGVAETNRSLVADRYDLGEASALELTEADTALFGATIQRNVARYERLSAELELRYARGDLEDGRYE